jgi:hypothetical protein
MTTFKSKSSPLVRIITIGFSISLLGTISMLLIRSGFSPYILPMIAVLLTILHLYFNSLNRIILNNESLILKKQIGQKEIKLKDINSVERLSNSNLTMTSGSNGVFGFVGSTMDNSVSFVKDRTQMIRILTRNKNYIISCEHPDELVELIRNIIGK